MGGSSKGRGSRRSSSIKSSGSRKSKGKSPDTGRRHVRRSRESRLAGGAAATAVVLLSTVANCIGMLGWVKAATSAYVSADVAVAAALSVAASLDDMLRALEVNLKTVRDVLTRLAGSDEDKLDSAAESLELVERKMSACYEVIEAFDNDYRIGNNGKAWTLAGAGRQMLLRFTTCIDKHLPALKQQELALGTTISSLTLTVATLSASHQLDGGSTLAGTSRPRPEARAQVLYRPTNLPSDVKFYFDPYRLQAKLRQRLDNPSSNGMFPLAATGLGGVGKSVMATVYCHAATLDAERYQLVWWVLAETRETCVQSLRELVDFLGENASRLRRAIVSTSDVTDVRKHNPGTSDWIAAVKNLLGGVDASWLLVFDNYSRHVHDVRDLIPPSMSSATKRHHVLLTTRDSDVGDETSLQVQLWKKDDADARFFHAVVFPSFDPDDGAVPDLLLPENQAMCKEQVREVCRRVDGLPLALSLIARDLHRAWRTNPRYDLRSILSKWDSLAQTGEVPMADGTPKQDHTMDAILLARDTLPGHAKGMPARIDAIMSSVAYVAADDIPITALRCDSQAVDWLVNRSLLSRADGETYSVHRLTQDAMRRYSRRKQRAAPWIQRKTLRYRQRLPVQRVLLLIGTAIKVDDEANSSLKVHAATALSWAQEESCAIPSSVKDELRTLTVRTAIEEDNVFLLRKLHEANPTSMVHVDAGGRHAFHHAFLRKRLDIMYWLVTEVHEFQHPTMIEPTTGCSLETLELDGHRIGDVGWAKLAALLGALTNVTTLNLADNRLTIIPKELGAFTNLTTLILGDNQLTSVPKELGALTNLTTLNLGNNQLTSVPKELGALTNLTTLNLDNNQLPSVPKELGALTNLTTLWLTRNQLTSVSKELGALTNLATLWLDNNQLTSVPKELGALTNLTWLLLSSNQLTSLPKDLGALTNLTTLWLDNNQLTSDSLHVLGALTNLTELSLHNNLLTTLPKELGALTNLTWLWLSNNQLTSDSLHVLGALTNLAELYLRNNNQLTSVGIPAPLQERAKSHSFSLYL